MKHLLTLSTAIGLLGLGTKSIETSKTSETPFTPETIQKVYRLAGLPSLTKESSLLAGIDPTTLPNFLSNSINTPNSQPNPIASTFPNLTTGTINGSYVMIPLDYDVAQRAIPKYKILKNAIHAILPYFPRDKYPLVLSTQIDHDVRGSGGLQVPDFSSAQFRFPFIDLLGDGYSTFSYIPDILVDQNPIAIAGARAYEENVIPATFDPPKDPYAQVPGNRDGAFYFNARRIGSLAPLSKVDLSTTYLVQQPQGRYGRIGSYPLDFYTNITNQPTFGCADSTCLLTCDNMIRFFGTNLTRGPYAPQGITGDVMLTPQSSSGVTSLPNGGTFQGLKGARFDVAFIENNFRDCREFKGYEYMGV